MTTTFRDRVALSCPSWASNWWLSRLIYAVAIQFDAIMEAGNMALRMRFATYAARNIPDALSLVGSERGIRRGYQEPDAAYAVRCTGWRAVHNHSGSPYVLMDQIAGYLAGWSVKLRVVNNYGVWFTREADGTRSWHWETPSNWSWDTGHGDPDSRYYLIVYVNDLPLYPVLWGIGLYRWGDGQLFWGGRFLQGIGQAIKDIVREWNPPHAQCDWVVFAKDVSSFDPSAPFPSAGFPNGTWDVWANRLSTALYMRGH